MISLREAARRHAIDPGYLSRRVRAGKAAKGYDLTKYAVKDADGTIKGFAFPGNYDFPADEPFEEEGARPNPSEPLGGPADAPSNNFSNKGQQQDYEPPSVNDDAMGRLIETLNENPELSAETLVEFAQLLGAAGSAAAAAKYVHDESSRKDENMNVWTSLVAGTAMFVATDYGLRKEESLLVRLGEWIGDRSNQQDQDPKGLLPAPKESPLDELRQPQTPQKQPANRKDQQRSHRA
jgi:hypothetical protein